MYAGIRKLAKVEILKSGESMAAVTPSVLFHIVTDLHSAMLYDIQDYWLICPRVPYGQFWFSHWLLQSIKTVDVQCPTLWFFDLLILSENATCTVDELPGLTMGQLYSLMSAGLLNQPAAKSMM